MGKVMAFGLLAMLGCANSRKAQVIAPANYTAKDGSKVATKDQPTPGGKIICEDEAPVGSHIPQRRCFYQEDIDANRQETQDYLHGQPAKNTKPGG